MCKARDLLVYVYFVLFSASVVTLAGCASDSYATRGAAEGAKTGAVAGAVGGMVTALVSVLGGQAVYDTDLDISWIGDANLAASNTFGLATGVSLGLYPGDTSGEVGIITAGGEMSWPGAMFWIDAMNAANYLGVNNWRLPNTLIPDPSCNNLDGTPNGVSGSYDCTGSEMGHLFYIEFNATRNTSVLSTGDPAELAKFTIVQSAYWSGTVYAPDTCCAWGFGFAHSFAGVQTPGTKNGTFSAWAVHDGNIGGP